MYYRALSLIHLIKKRQFTYKVFAGILRVLDIVLSDILESIDEHCPIIKRKVLKPGL